MSASESMDSTERVWRAADHVSRALEAARTCGDGKVTLSWNAMTKDEEELGAAAAAAVKTGLMANAELVERLVLIGGGARFVEALADRLRHLWALREVEVVDAGLGAGGEAVVTTIANECGVRVGKVVVVVDGAVTVWGCKVESVGRGGVRCMWGRKEAGEAGEAKWEVQRAAWKAARAKWQAQREAEVVYREMWAEQRAAELRRYTERVAGAVGSTTIHYVNH